MFVATVGTVCVNCRPCCFTAARTLSAPWPSTIGLPTGPGNVVPSSWAFTWSGVRYFVVLSLILAPWRSRAAAPLVIAVLNDVPEPTKLAVPITADGFWVSMVEPGARRLTTERPEVTRSGLNHPSGLVGPTLLKLVVVAPAGSVDPLSSRAPAVIARGSSPGERMVPLNGPALPDEATTGIPACHAVSTAWSRGLRTVEEVGMAPSERFSTRIRSWSRWEMTQLMPEITVARSVTQVAP